MRSMVKMLEMPHEIHGNNAGSPWYNVEEMPQEIHGKIVRNASKRSMVKW